MKRSWILFAAVVLSPALFGGCGIFRPGMASPPAGKGEAPGAEYRDGVYEGKGQGYRGPVLVLLYLKTGEITEIEIFHQDDVFVGSPAMEELAELVLEYNTAGLDGISGATESSAGFLAAVEDALSRARREADQKNQP
ncbi:MAG: FMN-binding protein [Treponema sp.]|nr:FMN-binding protein [Treponema sp.]